MMTTDRFAYYRLVNQSRLPLLFKIGGKFLYRTTDVMPKPDKIESLEKMLLESDSLADQAVKDLFQKGNARKAFHLINDILEQQSTKDFEAEIPDSLKTLFNQTFAKPDWLDFEKVEYGSHVCRRIGFPAMIALGDLALLGGYANANITKPLVFTGTLNGEHTFDRVNETTQFWLDVTENGGLKKGGKGFNSAIKVRIMHAVVRSRILQRKDWNVEAWGLPINAADAVATNVGFSMAMTLGVTMQGFKLSRKDLEAVLHMWKYIGYLMGDNYEWLPNTAEEGLQALLLVALADENQPDADSKELALDYLKNFLENDGSFLDKLRSQYEYQFHKAYAQFLIPPDLHKRLDLPRSYLAWLMIPMFEIPKNLLKEGLRHVLPGMSNRYDKMGRKRQKEALYGRMGDKRAKYIPREEMRKQAYLY